MTCQLVFNQLFRTVRMTAPLFQWLQLVLFSEDLSFLAPQDGEWKKEDEEASAVVFLSPPLRPTNCGKPDLIWYLGSWFYRHNACKLNLIKQVDQSLWTVWSSQSCRERHEWTIDAYCWRILMSTRLSSRHSQRCRSTGVSHLRLTSLGAVRMAWWSFTWWAMLNSRSWHQEVHGRSDSRSFQLNM